MKQTMKKCLTLLLALALLFTMAVPAAAAPATTYKKEITFTDVAQGDTVKAYQVMKYADGYNAYKFDKGFEMTLKSVLGHEANLDEEMKNANDTALKHIMISYVHMASSTATTGVSLPAPVQEVTADAYNKVQMTLEPGYYLLLVSTTATNNRTYMPVTVFVQVKNGDVKVSAAGNDITTPLSVSFKHENGPTVNVQVSDDSKGTAEWKTTAGGRVGEEMSFYMEVTTPNYESEFSLTTLAAKCRLAGLNYVAGSMKATADTNAASTEIANVIQNTDVGTDGNLTVNLDYSEIPVAASARKVYLHFRAVAAPEAVAAKATATADLQYVFSMEPTVTKTTAATTATVYTYAFSLAKTSDEDIEGGTDKKPLTNAGFTLYSDAEMTTTTAVSMIRVTDGAETYYRPALAGETGETVLLADMGADQNTLLVRGLDAATYYLKETKVPSGYYAPKGGFAVQLTGDREAVGETLTGKLAAASSFTATNNATDGVLINSSGLNTAEQNRLDASLKNSSTPVLPTTGGVGTVIFTVVGLLCMGAALWFFLFARRRRKDEQEQG